MTSGLPPGTAVLRRAGAFGPPAVASVLSLPVWLVFVGTVLLSVVLRWCRVGAGRRVGHRARPRIALRRATVSHRHDKAPSATLRGRAVTRTNATRSSVFPRPGTAVIPGLVDRSPPPRPRPVSGSRGRGSPSAPWPATTGSPVEPYAASAVARSPNQSSRGTRSPSDAASKTSGASRLAASSSIPGLPRSTTASAASRPGTSAASSTTTRAVAVGHDGGAGRPGARSRCARPPVPPGCSRARAHRARQPSG